MFAPLKSSMWKKYQIRCNEKLGSALMQIGKGSLNIRAVSSQMPGLECGN